MEVGFEGCLDMLMLCACCLFICSLKHTHTHTHTHTELISICNCWFYFCKRNTSRGKIDDKLFCAKHEAVQEMTRPQCFRLALGQFRKNVVLWSLRFRSSFTNLQKCRCMGKNAVLQLDLKCWPHSSCIWLVFFCKMLGSCLLAVSRYFCLYQCLSKKHLLCKTHCFDILAYTPWDNTK